MTWRQSLCLSNTLDISSQVWNTPFEKYFWIWVQLDSPDFLLDDILAVNSLSHLTEFILKVQPPNPIWAAEATKLNMRSYSFPPGRCSHSHLGSAAYLITAKGRWGWTWKGPGVPYRYDQICLKQIRLRCHMLSVTCHMSLTPTATAMDPSPANSPTMHSRIVRKDPKPFKTIS